MKKLILICLAVASFGLVQAQEERENTIETRLFPTYNSDYTYYFMRRNMRLDEMMFSTEVISHEDNAVDIRTKGFIPLHNSEKWNYTIPIYFDKYQFTAKDGGDLNVYNLFGQSVLSFFPNDKWNFSHIIEFRLKGAGEYFTKKEGNFIAQFVNARYHFDDKLSLTIGGLIGTGWDQNGDSETKAKPSIMLTYQPTKYLKLMAGMPGAGIEWSAPKGFDFMAHGLLDGDEYNMSVALRKSIGEKFDITARYLNEGFTELYTPTEALGMSNTTFDLEEIKQYQNKFQLEIGFRPEKNTIIQLIGGYGINRDLELQNTSGNTSSIAADDGMYFGVNLAKNIKL